MELQQGAVYGPVLSRRLGRSLGVNVAPAGTKVCNFNCAYCQYGATRSTGPVAWPDPDAIIAAADAALAEGAVIDRLTVAGNGEPTLHPGFARIVDGLVAVRDARARGVKLAILSNGSTLNRVDVVHALMQFDERYLKLDAGDATTLFRLNACPVSLGRLIADLRDLGAVTLQSMFVRDADGAVDNTTPGAVAAWLDAVSSIRPDAVHVYSLARTPAKLSLRPVDANTLDAIGRAVASRGIAVQVFH